MVGLRGIIVLFEKTSSAFLNNPAPLYLFSDAWDFNLRADCDQIYKVDGWKKSLGFYRVSRVSCSRMKMKGNDVKKKFENLSRIYLVEKNLSVSLNRCEFTVISGSLWLAVFLIAVQLLGTSPFEYSVPSRKLNKHVLMQRLSIVAGRMEEFH